MTTRRNKMNQEEIFLPQGRANIKNNNNNNNKINNIKTFNDDAGKTSDNQVTPVLRTPLGEASPPESGVLGQEARGVSVIAETPPWKYIKVDLYDNATDQDLAKGIRKLKLKLSYLLPGQTSYKKVTASLGGRWRDVKRGMDLTSNQDDIQHYNKIQEVYELFGNELTNASASKCFESSTKGKGNSIFGLSVVLGELPTYGEYAVAVIFEDQAQIIQLEGQYLTPAQRKKNQIATGSWGTSNVQRVTLRDFNGR